MVEKTGNKDSTDPPKRFSRRHYLTATGIAALGLGLSPNVAEAASQGPYDGSASSVPGRIQAEDFDTGGEGVAYHDTSSGNDGGAYRDTDVDIESTDDASGAYNVGWIESGEWLEYTVDVTDASSTYDVLLRVAGKNAASGGVTVTLGGTTLGSFDIPDTGGWQNWTTVKLSDVSLPSTGQQRLRLEMNDNHFNVNWVEFQASESSGWSVPGRIQAEDFDTGGEGVAYHDTSSGNDGGAYRDTDVDIESTDDASGAYNVGWIESGEWLEYTVDVTDASSTYDVLLRVAGKNAASGGVTVTLGGTTLGSFDIPDTGGWQNWTTVKLSDVSLPSTGQQRLRLEMNDNHFNVNWVELKTTDTSSDVSGSAPAVDTLSVSEVETSNSDAEFDVDWAVGDTDSDLSSVDLTLSNVDTGSSVDATSISVSGSSASSTTRLVASGEDGSGATYEAELTVTDTAGNTSTETVSVIESEPSGQAPYGGTAWQLPGRVQAEDFDTGGSGTAYQDSTSGNDGGSYRDTDVDIQSTKDTSGNYNVGWIESGEWLEYTADVTDTSTTYDVLLRVAGTNAASGGVTVTLGGTTLGSFDIPDTGGWQNWTTVRLSDVSLPATGEQTLRLDFEAGKFNVNWVDFTTSSGSVSVESLSLSEVETSDGDAEFDADWAVSDAQDDLSSVDLTLNNVDTGSTVDSTVLSVSGGSATDTSRLVADSQDSSGDTYEVSCLVADEAGNSDQAKVSSTESEPVSSGDTEQWGLFEVSFTGPSSGNPYQDVDFSATFTHDSSGEQRVVRGFWDGNDVYRLRFMPDMTGTWNYQTTSNASSLDGVTGGFTANSPSSGNLGPVTIDSSNKFHFVYEEGPQFYPVGTTAYGWAQVEEKKRQITLDSLDTYGSYDGTLPFNKVRMSITPHKPTSDLDSGNDGYRDERSETVYVDNSKKDEVNPDWFQLVDQAVEDLLDRGIQADLIPFHLWAHLQPGDYSYQEADKLMEYMVARYGAYRNVWWCLSNEWNKTDWNESRWHDIGGLVRSTEFYRHLASNHDWPCSDFGWDANWVTHISTQRPIDDGCGDVSSLRDLRASYDKALVNDEYRYEGDQGYAFETSAEKAVVAHWRTVLAGGYASHGETYDQEFFRGGGDMHGESTQRVAFLRSVLLDSPSSQGHEPLSGDVDGAHKGEDYYIYYYGEATPNSISYDLPNNTYSVDVLDTWNMTVTNKGEHSGSFSIDLPGDPYVAVRIERV